LLKGSLLKSGRRLINNKVETLCVDVAQIKNLNIAVEIEFMKACKGAIAFCSLGRLGLITSETPVPVTYNDGNKGISWVGIQLTDGEVTGVGGDKGKVIKQKVGDPWMSKNPTVVGRISDYFKEDFLN